MSSDSSEEAILKLLLGVHQEGASDTDFLLGNLKPRPHLARVSMGCIQPDLNVLWIGDNEAFAAYQELRYSTPIPSEEASGSELPASLGELSRMGRAFGELLRRGEHRSVAEPAISVITTAKGLEYAVAAVVHPPPQTIPSGVATKIHLGSAAQGGY